MLSRILNFLNKKFSRFVFWGSLSLGPYYVALYVLTDHYGLWYLPTAIVGMFLVHVLNFFLQKHWAFENRRTDIVQRQMTYYGLWAVVNYTSGTLLLYVLVEYVGLWYVWSQGVVTIVVSTVSYFVTKRIFRD